jgi:hypothetical protein
MVQRSGDNLFAGPALPLDQHAGFGLRYAAYLPQKSHHLGAGDNRCFSKKRFGRRIHIRMIGGIRL